MANNTRRAPWHDYKSRCLYHITITKSPDVPSLGHVRGDINAEYGDVNYPRCVESAIGKVIFFNIKAIPKLHNHLKILQFVIMPDHVHFLIFVENELPEHLGFFISRFKYFTKLELRRKNMIGEKANLFEPSFHDRILHPKHKIDTIINYIRENPKRFLIIRNFSDFYIKEDKLINGTKCQIYGNPMLLENPFKEAVVVHRIDTEDIIARKSENWMHLAGNGGVLVGAFVSKEEKKILNSILEIGGKVIYINGKAFLDKEKPSGRLFHHCASGNLLIIHPYEMIRFANLNNPGALTRNSCIFMNNFAEALTEG